MKIHSFHSFIYGRIFETSGIMDDVINVSNFIISDLENKEIKDKDTYKYDIDNHKITICIDNNFLKEYKADAMFKVSKSPDKHKIYVSTPLNTINIYHEIAHFIRYKKLGEKIEKCKNKLLRSSKLSGVFVEKTNFDNLLHIIYLCDDSEMNSYIHETYYMLVKNREKYKKLTKNDFFNRSIIMYDISNPLINYNIFEDLKNVTEKDKKIFFGTLLDLNITSDNIFSKLRVIYKTIFNKYDNYDNVNSIMNKIQKHINSKGLEYKKRLSKIYNLID